MMEAEKSNFNFMEANIKHSGSKVIMITHRFLTLYSKRETKKITKMGMYRVYRVYRVYSVYRVYRVYRVYSVYRVYRV